MVAVTIPQHEKEALVKTHSNRCRLLVFFLLLFTASSVALAQSQPDLSSLGPYIQASMKDWKVPGVGVTIVENQAPVYAKGFGVRNLQTGAPVDADTLFDIGSCTKAFTAASIAMLVDEGKMRWDGNVRDYIPFFRLYDPLADEEVTIRDLLTHRTGEESPDFLFGSPFTREQMIRHLAFVKPNAGFRTLFQYNNMMYVTAGYAVGQVSGGTWGQFVRQRIFEPLGMTDSMTSVAQAEKAPDSATPYVEKDGKVVPIPWVNIDVVGPAGSISSSPRDMAKWIAFQLNDGVYDGKRLISHESMEEMHTPQIVVPPGEIKSVFFPDAPILTYGMGWFIEDYRGHELILHPGDIDGFSALVVLIPELHAGYSVLINLGPTGITYRQVLGYHIADVLLGLPPEDWSSRFMKLSEKFTAAEKQQTQAWQAKRNPNTHPSHDLSAYVGDYQDPVYGKSSISLEDGKLVFHLYSHASPLQHFQYDTFVLSLEGEQQRLTFAADADGNIVSFTAFGITFRRVAGGPGAKEM